MDVVILHSEDKVCRAFEEASRALLKRNRKTIILGQGSREGRQVDLSLG
jgi:hypothetical protein